MGNAHALKGTLQGALGLRLSTSVAVRVRCDKLIFGVIGTLVNHRAEAIVNLCMRGAAI